MSLFEHKRLGRVLEIALILMMILAAVLMATLHWTIPDVTMRVPGEPERLYEKYYTVLMVSGVIAELILWQAFQVMRNIRKGLAFSKDTVRRLNMIGWDCLSLAFFYFVAVFAIHKFFMVVVFVAFAIIGLVLFMIAQLFNKASEYKSENDMTI